MQSALPLSRGAALLPPEPSVEQVATVVDRLARSYKRHPRRSGCGPRAAWYELWATLAADGEMGSRRLAGGRVPPEVLRAFLVACIVGLPKNEAGVRPLGCEHMFLVVRPAAGGL